MADKKEKDNFLDYIPMKNSDFTWKVKENNRVEIAVKNTGCYNKIAQIFFRRPKISYIELDELGSFVWQQIDGKQTIYEISEKMKVELGEKAEPVVERLVQFVRALQVNRYISFANKDRRR